MKASLPDVVRHLDGLDDAEVTVTLPAVTAGRLIRRRVRTILAAGMLDGVVTYHEDRGLLDSVFIIRIEGRGRLVRHHLVRLLTLLKEIC